MDQLIKQIGRIIQQIEVLPAVVDILILVFLIYGLLSILRGTRAEILVRGLIILFGVAFIVVNIVQLPVLKWVVTNSLQFIIFAIIVIFAPELRRTLEQIGHTSDFINRPLGQRTNDVLRATIEEVITTAFYLSNQRWGGLVVIERETGLQDLANRGVPIEGRVSTQLLSNIFVPNTPLHDGAVIIRGDQIVAAKVILPLADISSRAEQHGTRHKAALGISEQSDAIIVVVSEETGNVSLAHSGKLITKLDRERLRYNLRTLLEPAPGLGLGRRKGRRKPLTTSVKGTDNNQARNKATGAVKDVKEDIAKVAKTVKETPAQKEKGTVTNGKENGAANPNRETVPLNSTAVKETTTTTGGSNGITSVNGNGSKETVSTNGATNGYISKETVTTNGASNKEPLSANGSTAKENISSNGATSGTISGNGNNGSKDAAPVNGNGTGEADHKDSQSLKDGKDEQASVARSEKR